MPSFWKKSCWRVCMGKSNIYQILWLFKTYFKSISVQKHSWYADFSLFIFQPFLLSLIIISLSVYTCLSKTTVFVWNISTFRVRIWSTPRCRLVAVAAVQRSRLSTHSFCWNATMPSRQFSLFIRHWPLSARFYVVRSCWLATFKLSALRSLISRYCATVACFCTSEKTPSFRSALVGIIMQLAFESFF